MWAPFLSANLTLCWLSSGLTLWNKLDLYLLLVAPQGALGTHLFQPCSNTIPLDATHWKPPIFGADDVKINCFFQLLDSAQPLNNYVGQSSLNCSLGFLGFRHAERVLWRLLHILTSQCQHSILRYPQTTGRHTYGAHVGALWWSGSRNSGWGPKRYSPPEAPRELLACHGNWVPVATLLLRNRNLTRT